MKFFFTIWLAYFFLYFQPAFGQTGPGGVGNRLVTSDLKIWLRADDIDADNDFTNNPAVNSSINQWRDYSGSNYHFSNSGSFLPTYRLSGTIPSVFFNANLATAQFLNNTTTGTYSSSSAFFACNNINIGNSNCILDNSSTSLRFEQISNTLVIGFTRYGVLDYFSSIPSPFGTNSIISYHKTSTASTIDLIANTTTTNFSVGTSATGIPIDRLGRNSTGVDEISGDYFEVIVYNNRINSAQLVIVNNYLSSKYNINIPNNIYVQDNPANGTFKYDVAGIGRVNSTNLHNDSQGTGIVRILNPLGLGDNEFLIWGHNNAAVIATNTTDVHSTVDARFQRIWRVNEVNATGTAVDVGSIDIRFDLSGNGPITPSDLRLLVDINNNGMFNDDTPVPITASSLGSGIYVFSGVSQIANGLRFTLGTANSINTPLPISLISFEATLLDKNVVELNWQTASETNNAFFTVERSKDGTSWATIESILGAGNSLSPIQYNIIDQDPLTNISYYRLKQTDLDGKSSYSKVVAVHNTMEKLDEIYFYPNPAKEHLQVIGDFSANNTIEFYNSLWQNITSSVELQSANNSTLIFDTSNLNTGLYFARFNGEILQISNSLTKKEYFESKKVLLNLHSFTSFKTFCHLVIKIIYK